MRGHSNLNLTLKHLFPVVLLVVLSGGASGADLHVCDCASGADPDCVTGDDLNPGTPALPLRSYENARNGFAGLAPGEAVRFCRGGSWDVSAGSRWINNNCLAAQPCEITDYDAPWASGDENRPRILRGDGGHGFAFEDGGNADHEEGYVIANLELLGDNSTPNDGVFFYNDIDDVVLSNLHIEGFGIGVHVAGSNPCGADPACDGRNERITLRDSVIINNHVQGWLGGSNGSRISNNIFDGNGSTPVFDHNVYLAGNTTGMAVVGNVLRNNTPDGGGQCSSVSMVAHGNHDDLLIEGNRVEEQVGAAGQGCWGISVDPAYGSPESFTNVRIRNNAVINVGNVGIGIAACANCVVENNIVVQQQPFGITAISAPVRAGGAGDLLMDEVTVRNNSMWLDLGSGATGIQLASEGNGHILASNVIHYTGGAAAFNCFNADLPPVDYQAMDHNLCFSPSAPGAEWNDGFGTLAQWQSASGLDQASSTTDPGFADSGGGDFSAANGSAGMVNAGDPAFSSALDINDLPRDAAPDAGAHEWVQSVLFADDFEPPLQP